jgi:hypothetical protein
MKGVIRPLVTALTMCALFVPASAREESQPMRAFTLTLESGAAAHNMQVIQFRRGHEVVFIAFDGGDSNMIDATCAGAPVDAGKIICSGEKDDMPNMLAQVLSKWLM